jgi:hypothetical protein
LGKSSGTVDLVLENNPEAASTNNDFGFEFFDRTGTKQSGVSFYPNNNDAYGNFITMEDGKNYLFKYDDSVVEDTNFIEPNTIFAIKKTDEANNSGLLALYNINISSSQE